MRRLSILALCGMMAAAAQTPQSGARLITIEDAVRIALAYNQALRAQRLNVNQNRAQEITAGLKPNPNFTTVVDTIPLFSPTEIRLNTQVYSQSLSYTYERGGKREKRVDVARDNTKIAAQTVTDNERTLRFQVAQAFVNVLLAKSVLQFATQDLDDFSREVELNRARMKSGDLAEGDFLKISLQKLQFQQDVSTAQLSLVQSRAALRQLLGYESVADDFDISGELAHKGQAVQLADLEKQALDNRPDLQAARAGVKLASDTVALAYANRAKDWTWSADYTFQSIGPNLPGNAVGASFSVDLPIHDRNQGEIARSQAALRQAEETENSVAVGVRTDVINAFYGLQTDGQVASLYESGYLDQATQSRDITNYAYGRGAASVLDVLDAERNYRATQLGYRQAVAAYMIAAEQVNQAVGARVIQ